jgi:cell division protease FtsH
MSEPKDEKRPDRRRAEPPTFRGPGWSSRVILTWLIVAALAIAFLQWGRKSIASREREVDSREFWQYVQQKKISKAVIVENEGKVEGEVAPGVRLEDSVTTVWYRELAENLKEVPKRLDAAGVVWVNHPARQWLGQLIGPVLMASVTLLALYFLFWRPLRGANSGNILSFGRSRARLVTRERTRVTFDDVAGIEEAKEDVKEIIEFLKNPRKFQRLGGRIPRGVLLVGPPGTGKTLLAKAIAGEADVPFFSISGSDFVEMFVGVGASRVRDLFRQAKDNAPCIIFLDEIDAVGRRRGYGWGGGHDEREQTLNAILVEMDGFETDTEVVVVAATNRPDVLDPALLRPGRFDREVVLDMPDLRAREEILRVHARKVKVAPNVDLNILARGTPGFTGAELEAVINEGALLATLKGSEAVKLEDLEEARDKVRWGRQKRSRVMDEQDRRITAYHEAGHTLAAKALPGVEPVHKVTIVPRGRTLGATMQLPEKDRYHYSRRQILSTVTMLLAGRAAEERFCNDVTTGASHDLKQATELVRLMVREWGMSDRVGPIDYSQTEDMLFGGEVVSRRNYSEAIALEIDQEVKRLIEECYGRARSLLEERADALRRLAEALLVHEVLDNEQVDAVLAGKSLPRPAGVQADAKSPAAAPEPAAGPKKQLDGEGGDLRGQPTPGLVS